MKQELQALEANNTWSLPPLCISKHTIGCKWVYKVKYKSDGTLEKYKARLVAKDFTQQFGIDSVDTFSTVAKMTTIKLVMVVASMKGWIVH